MAVSNQREVWIDHAKAIAMILIILGHISSGLSGWFNFKFVFGFHLVVFFVLSGYTIKRKTVDFSFLKQKFTRLMTPYFITCAAVMIMDLINCFIVYKERSIAQITFVIAKDLKRSFFASGTIESFGQINMGQRIGAIWFLPALFFAILFFQLLVNTIKDNRLLGLASAAVSLIGYLTATFIWLPFSIQSGMFAVFFLWTGYSIKNKALLETVRWYYSIPALIILLAGIYFKYCEVHFVVAYVRDLIISPLVGFSGALLVYLAAKYTVNLKLLGWIGRNTLNILCVHLLSLETLGPYYYKILKILRLDGQVGVWAKICMELAATLIGTWLLLFARDRIYASIKKRICEKTAEIETKPRDPVVDITRGIFILSMLIGRFEIDSTLRGIIYSCHMVAFVFLSGYCYKKTEHFWRAALHMVWTFLVPYLLCCIANILLDIPQWSGIYFASIIKTYGLGMSFSKKMLININSIGPVYFILMLFVVRFLYMIIDKVVKKDIIKWSIILLCTAVGIFLGNQGFWLPWSIDCALYSMIFYHTGVMIKKHRVLEYMSETPWLYFILSSVWAFTIHKGGMELATRCYGVYGLVLIGAVSGTTLVCSLSQFFSRTTIVISLFLKRVGHASLIILIVHQLLNARIGSFIGRFLSVEGFAWMTLCIVSQVLLAVLIDIAISVVFRNYKSYRNKQAIGL